MRACIELCGAYTVTGTITSVMDGKCLQVSGGKNSAVNVAKCTGGANQAFEFIPSGHTVDYVYTVQQGDLCIDQN